MNRCLLLLTGLLLSLLVQAQPYQYPPARKSSTFDTFFDQRINDPYRWLEDKDSEPARAWWSAQSALFDDWYAKQSQADSLYREVEWKSRYARFTLPVQAGQAYVYHKDDGNARLPMVWLMRSAQHVPMLYYDANRISEDGSIRVENLYPSPDGRFIVFALSNQGSEWQEYRIKETQSMKSLPEKLGWIMNSEVAWYGQGFYYSRYRGLSASIMHTAPIRNQQIFYHRLNTEQDKDSLVFEAPQSPEYHFKARVDAKGKFLIVSGFLGDESKEIWLARTDGGQKPEKLKLPVTETLGTDFRYLGCKENTLYFLARQAASPDQIFTCNALSPEKGFVSVWKNPGSVSLDYAGMALNRLLISRKESGVQKIDLYSLNEKGQPAKATPITLPPTGAMLDIRSSESDSNAFVSWVEGLNPPRIYRIELRRAIMYELLKSPPNYYPPVVERIEKCKLPDGTETTINLWSIDSLRPNADSPLLIYLPQWPVSKPEDIPREWLVGFLNRGGTIAFPHILPYSKNETSVMVPGEAPLVSALALEAAIGHLHKQSISSPSKTAIYAKQLASLPVAVLLQQKPSLCKAVVYSHGYFDAVRGIFMNGGAYWREWLGWTENKAQTSRIIAYSPLHNPSKESPYPAIILQTADDDDCISPVHSLKFTASQQENSQNTRPILLQTTTQTGTTQRMPREKRLKEYTAALCFIIDQLGMQP